MNVSTIRLVILSCDVEQLSYLLIDNGALLLYEDKNCIV